MPNGYIIPSLVLNSSSSANQLKKIYFPTKRLFLFIESHDDPFTLLLVSLSPSSKACKRKNCFRVFKATVLFTSSLLESLEVSSLESTKVLTDSKSNEQDV